MFLYVSREYTSPHKPSLFVLILNFGILFIISVFMLLCICIFTLILYLGELLERLSIKKWPETERPREKLFMLGPDKLSDCELLAILLQTGFKHGNNSISAIDLAKEILIEFKELKGLINALPSELLNQKGIGQAKASKLVASFELGRRAAALKNGNRTSFRCSEDVASYYIPILRDLKKEQFRVLLLDTKNKIIKDELISQGSLTTSPIHPREVINPAIRGSAASVIFLHNHPSGDPEPSMDDIEVTKRLCNSFNIVGISVLDHIIVGYDGYFSFKQKQMI
jgi:DNA repair protein RadC